MYNINCFISIISICYLSNNANSGSLLSLNFLKILKKKRLEASLFLNLAQLKIDDCKLKTANTTNIDNMDNTDNKSETWFWNDSTNKTDLNTEKKRNRNYENNLKGDESKTEKAVSSEIHKIEIK